MLSVQKDRSMNENNHLGMHTWACTPTVSGMPGVQP